jgi:hypothetical protein
MSKILLLIIVCVFSVAHLSNAQQNEFGYTKEKMAGEFVGVVTHVNEKVIYAIDMNKFATEDARVSFLGKIHGGDKVFPISIPDQEGVLFVAGYESVIKEDEAKVLILQYKQQSENGPAPSSESKAKFSAQ